MLPPNARCWLWARRHVAAHALASAARAQPRTMHGVPVKSAAVAAQILGALTAMHEDSECLTHRDIKPGNIMAVARHDGPSSTTTILGRFQVI